MAIAISGAIITGQTGTLMNYKKKCEKCGQVQPGTTSSPAPKSRGTKMNSSFKCYKCGNMQKIIIQGDK